METKKNYKKPQYEEVLLNAKTALLAGSCANPATDGQSQEQGD